MFTDIDPQLYRSIKAACFLRARPVGDLCLSFPAEPSCSRGVNIAPGCFVRDRGSHALLVNP